MGGFWEIASAGCGSRLGQGCWGTAGMAFFPVFLSVVYIVRNQAAQLGGILQNATAHLSSLASDYELIIVDNASDDESVSVLKTMTGQDGLPNL
jgi:hypothetical protein